jgi:hypothetical protein
MKRLKNVFDLSNVIQRIEWLRIPRKAAVSQNKSIELKIRPPQSLQMAIKIISSMMTAERAKDEIKEMKLRHEIDDEPQDFKTFKRIMLRAELRAMKAITE